MNNQDEEKKQFYEDESKNLRANYNKVIKGEESQQNAERDRAQLLLWIVCIVYTVLLTSFVLLLYRNSEFRFASFEFLQDLSENGSIHGSIMVGLVGFVFVLTGLNVVLYDIMVGFLLKPYWYGLLIVSIAKILAKFLGFIIGRYLIRSFIYKALNENIYFITCYLAAERKPVNLMFSVQFLFIVTPFKTYACGLFRITNWQYLYPTIFGTVLWAAFWVYVGNRLENIISLLNSGDTSSYMPWYIKLVLTLIAILILIYFYNFTKGIYNDIKNLAELDKLSEIIEREERQTNGYKYQTINQNKSEINSMQNDTRDQEQKRRTF